MAKAHRCGVLTATTEETPHAHGQQDRHRDGGRFGHGALRRHPLAVWTELAIGLDRQALGRLEGQPATTLFDQGIIELGDINQNVMSIDGFEAAARLAGLGPGNGKQRVEGLQQAVRFLDGAVQRLAIFAGLARPQGQFDTRLDAGERRAQVMGDVAGNLLHAVHQPLNAFQHLVQGFGQAVKFIAAA